MLRRLALCLCLLLPAGATCAEVANLIQDPQAASGAAAQLVLAQRVYRQAEASGDPVLLLAAIRLARGVTTRAAPGWVRIEGGDTAPIPGPERSGPPNPGNEAAVAALLGLAADDPTLQDLAYDLGAQRPDGRRPVATIAPGGLAAGAEDSWRVPLSGAVAAEIALLGDGGGPLGLTVTDDAGLVICARAPSIDPALCRFTPARNGFFTAQVTNAGPEWNSYQLVGN